MSVPIYIVIKYKQVKMEGSSGAAVGIVVLFCFCPVSIVKLELTVDANQRLCPFLA